MECCICILFFDNIHRIILVDKMCDSLLDHSRAEMHHKVTTYIILRQSVLCDFVGAQMQHGAWRTTYYHGAKPTVQSSNTSSLCCANQYIQRACICRESSRHCSARDPPSWELRALSMHCRICWARWTT